MNTSKPLALKTKADLKKLRRISLAHQGLTKTNPFGRGRNAALKAIAHLGYVQIDTISVVERAHHHVLSSRVSNYAPTMLHQLLARREVFEYWAHAAAFLPIHAFRYSLPFKHAFREGHFQRSTDEKLMRELMARIRTDGPLRSRDIEEPKRSQAGWWDWKPAKRALEQLFMQGDLMITARDGFQKTYDLAENVLPSSVDTSTPTPHEYAQHLIDDALRCHGFASLKGIAYLRRDNQVRTAAKELVTESVKDGVLLPISIQGSTPYYIKPETLDARAPNTPAQVKILSPFDNSVIQRERVNRLFGFDYQIECYVPQAKRKFGYFCLPLLYKDEFVGRMDCKTHRDTNTFSIKSLHIESHGHDDDAVATALGTALGDFMAFQDCTSVKLERVNPARKTTLYSRIVDRNTHS